jgi:hypothetical protein
VSLVRKLTDALWQDDTWNHEDLDPTYADVEAIASVAAQVVVEEVAMALQTAGPNEDLWRPHNAPADFVRSYFSERVCPQPGGCDSCPDPDHCRKARIAAGLTTEEAEERAR